MAGIEIDIEALGGIKGLRSTLSQTRSAIAKDTRKSEKQAEHIHRLSLLINQLDAYRPVDENGKHGDLHTLFCGCEIVKDLLERTPFQS